VNYVIVNLVRSVGPTSMPWNDLDGGFFKNYPEIDIKTIKVGLNIESFKIKEAPCNGQNRKYISVGLISSIFFLLNLIRQEKKQSRKVILHVHNPNLAWLAFLILGLSTDIKVCGNLHNEWSGFSVFQRISLRLLALISSAFICVSEDIAKKIPNDVRTRFLQKKTIFSVRNGIFALDLDQAYPVALLENERFPDVVVVAKMEPQKNVDLIIDVFSRLKNARKLIWFGTGSEHKKIVGLAKKLNIEERIVLKGVRPRSEVFDALKKSAVYLACSRWEGIGVANIEAAAMGCYPFLSSIGPHEEIAGMLGFCTYPLDNADLWAKKIDAFLCVEGAERNRRARDLAELTRSTFDFDGRISEYKKIYENVLY
jgi:glycosyltransferase involved in cell wall biosynthesis